jgi:NNP family nitrate/nitrite transporter-like MFS transporter
MEQKSFREGIAPLTLIIFLFFTQIFSRTLLSPLLLEIEGEFSLSHTQASRFFIFISIGASTMTLFSGFVSARLRHKGTIFLSSMIIVIALLLMSVAPSVWSLQIILLLLGAGNGLYPPSGISTITTMFDKRDWQKALSLHELGPHFAMAVVPLFAVVLGGYTTWRGITAAAAGLVLFAAVIFQIFVRFDNQRGEPPTFMNLVPLIRLPSFWILVISFGFALGSIQGIYLLIPTFMISEAGFSPVYTNTIFGISRFIPAAALLTAGLLLDKVGVKKTLFVTVLLSGVTIIFLGIFSGSWLTAAVFLQPAVGALAVPAALSAISAVGPPSSRNVSLSMALPVASFIGNGGIPAFAGFMGDALSFSAGFIIIGAVMICLAFLTGFITLNID